MKAKFCSDEESFVSLPVEIAQAVRFAGVIITIGSEPDEPGSIRVRRFMLENWDVCGRDEANFLNELAADVRQSHEHCACVEVSP